MVLGTNRDGYLQFSWPGVKVYNFSWLPDFTYRPVRYAEEIAGLGNSTTGEASLFNHAIDYGAQHGGINLIVTTFDAGNFESVRNLRKLALALTIADKQRADNQDPSKVAELEESFQAAKLAYTTGWNRARVTEREFARALDLFPDQVVYWRREGGRWHRIHGTEHDTVAGKLMP